MVIKRQRTRYIIKLPVEVKSDSVSLSGTTVRVSEKGMFVRSQKNFSPGTDVNLMVSLPDGSSCRMKGIVRFVRTVDILRRNNGMGIEITEEDLLYISFIRSVEKYMY